MIPDIDKIMVKSVHVLWAIFATVCDIFGGTTINSYHD